jgi:hypothetical protein
MFLLGAGTILAAALASLPAAAHAGAGSSMIRLADKDGGNGGGDMTVDLTVRQVTVEPIRAHVGDVVRIDVWIENRFEGRATTPAEVKANGKVVGSQLFTWGDSAGDRTYKLTFNWNTRGLAPGEYKIRATAFVSEDSSPFDNDLDVKQPVVLVAPGGGFPGGEKAGGSFTETDPRYKTIAGG